MIVLKKETKIICFDGMGGGGWISRKHENFCSCSYLIIIINNNLYFKVLSNMPCISVCDEVFTFARSPALPTYLVCVILGYYDSISRYIMFCNYQHIGG